MKSTFAGTRRDLLKVSSSLAAAPVLLAQEKELRVGVIGVGLRGTQLLDAILKSPGVKVVAICDVDPQALQRGLEMAKAHKPEPFTKFRDLLDRKDIDVVFIATPPELHKEMSVSALEVHKNVYLEKPIGRTAQEVNAVVRASQSSRGVLQLGFQFRYAPARRAAVEHIHKGGIGKVAYMQAEFHVRDLPRNQAWVFDKGRAGNAVVERGVLLIDSMNWVMNTHPVRAVGSGGINVYKDQPAGRSVHDNAVVIFEYPGDVRFSYSHLYINPNGFSPISERVWGTEGAVNLTTGMRSRLDPQGSQRAEETKLWTGNQASFAQQTQDAVDDFFRHARNKTQPLNNAQWAQWASVAAIMAQKAIDEKRAVTWDEVAGS